MLVTRIKGRRLTFNHHSSSRNNVQQRSQTQTGTTSTPIFWVIYAFIVIVMSLVAIILILTIYFTSHGHPNNAIDINNNFDQTQSILGIHGHGSTAFANHLNGLDGKQRPRQIVGADDKNENGTQNNFSFAIPLTAYNTWPLISGGCESSFGNGFSREILSCITRDKRSFFICRQNPYSLAMYCMAKNLIVDINMIEVADGGETVYNVLHRKERAEFPRYLLNVHSSKSALNIGCYPNGEIPPKNEISYYMHDMIHHLKKHHLQLRQMYTHKYVQHCGGNTAHAHAHAHANRNTSANDDGRSRSGSLIYLIVVRYEYANLYHQITEWFNVYQTIHSLGLQQQMQDIQLVFFDGHSWSSLDEGWDGAFNPHVFVKQLTSETNIVCMNRAILVPAGYTSALSILMTLKGLNCNGIRNIRYVQHFSEWFLAQFNIYPKSKRFGVGNDNDNDNDGKMNSQHGQHPNETHQTTENMMPENENENENENEAGTELRDHQSDIHHIHKAPKQWSPSAIIQITLILRKTYVAHPRNIHGNTERQFESNAFVEQIIIDAIRMYHERENPSGNGNGNGDPHSINNNKSNGMPGMGMGMGMQFIFQSVAWEEHTFTEQLRIASATDILIGVHGAGLSHVLFLPAKSGLIEIVPYGYEGEPHFETLAHFCGHYYLRISGSSEFRVRPSERRLQQKVLQMIDLILLQP